MTTLLQINTGIFGEHSNSTVLANEFAANFQANNPNTNVVVRDLVSQPLPHLDANIIGAFASDELTRTPEQQALLAQSQALIDELEAADAVVIGVPMYNFSVPSQLKAYMDQVARAGITFKYTENGPQGLLADKPVYILAARGGIHAGTDRDSQTSFIKTFFNFIGLQNVNFIYAEGLNMGETVKEQAYLQAKQQFQLIPA